MTVPATPALRSKAHLVAMTVADNIRRIINMDSDGPQPAGTARRPWMKGNPGGEDYPYELSLSDGYPGIALLFAELAAHDRSWQAPLHSVLSAAAPRARSAPAFGLFGGVIALAFALHMARMATGGYQVGLTKLHAAINQAIKRQLATDGVRKRIASRGLAMADYDVVSGLSGTLRYLLLSPSANSDLIALVLEELVSVAHVKRGRPGWTVMHPPSVVSDPADFPFGHVNVGLAHGAAGILAAISLATSAGVLVPGQEEAIETLSNWLLAVQLTEPGGLNWPPFLGHRDATVTGTRAHNGWCYGIPGIARSLQLAGKAMENSNWTNAADAAMKSMVDRSTADYVVGEPGLCHGWAGTMHATWRFATNSTGGAMDHWVDTAAASVIASYEPGSQFGFRSAIYSPSDSPVWTDDGGFITGAAGIALALHRYSRDAIPATLWDSALLVV